jgi:hypothetical protein
LYREWQYLVQQYSRARLTYTKDKLPALSGLAKVFTRRLKDDYVAGLWKGNLFRGILWSAGNNTTAAATYRAPTWSWASVDGFVTYPVWDISECQREPLARTICAVTTPLTEDVTGQVTGGYLLISGPLRKFTIQGNATRCVDKLYLPFEFMLSVRSEGRPPSEGDAVLHPCMSHPFPDLIVNPSTHDMVIPGEIFLMPLICLHRAKANVQTTHGLVLCQNEARGIYVKIGTFDIFKRSTLQSLFLNKHSLHQQHYEEYDGATQYTIRIL